MKKKTLTTLAVLGLTLLVTTACSNDNVKQKQSSNKISKVAKSNNESTTNQTTAASISPEETQKAIRTAFDNITVGDLMNSGQGGTSKDDVLKTYGNPASTSTMAVNGMNVEQVTWSGSGDASGITISIQFVNNSVTNKMISGYQFTREAKIGLTKFNELANGAFYTDVVKSFGEPDTYSESLTNSQKMVTAGWTSGIKGSIGANFNAQFTNDQLTTKSQAGMTD